MEKTKKIRIAVLDDSIFFNNILTRQIKAFTEYLSTDKGISFQIHSYINPHDFLINTGQETDVAIIDYFLTDNVTGLDVLKKIRERNEKCKIIMISHTKTIKTSIVSILEGAFAFIPKDKSVLTNICLAIEDAIFPFSGSQTKLN